MIFDSGKYFASYSLLFPLAELGNAVAQCYIGTMYHLGLGVNVDGVQAVTWYLKSAGQCVLDHNISAVAYNNLSTIYTTGCINLNIDLELAKKYQSKSKELGFEM